MIDEARTLELFGYTSDELKPKSGKHIVVVCEECGRVWTLRKQDHHSDICKHCAQIGKYVSDTTRLRNSEAMKRRPPVSDETKQKMVESNKGSTSSTRIKLSEAWKNRSPISDEHRQHLSAGHMGIPYDEWDGFAKTTPYCPKFNDSCKERNRDKYDRQCFVCGKSEYDNGRRLSVHHVDLSKSQGCDGEKWKLVPLCGRCHGKAHKTLLQFRIEYLFKYI